MSYPTRLLPKTTDKVIHQVDPQHLLCRWVDVSLQLKDSTGGLSAEAVEEKRLPGYSTNKIPPSLPEDVKLKFRVEVFGDRWTEGEAIAIPSEGDFTYEDRQYFLFRIEDIYQFGKPYSFPPNSPSQNCYFKIDIIHKPLKANISHFEFDIKSFTAGGQPHPPPKPSSSTFKKVIASEIRNRLIRIAKFSIEEFGPSVLTQNQQVTTDIFFRRPIAIILLIVLIIAVLGCYFFMR